MSEEAIVSATIRLTSYEENIQDVPIDVLVRTLSGLQQLVYLLATVQENRKVGHRFRVAQEIQQGYMVSCQIPKAGSYAIPITLKSSDNQLSLFNNYQQILQNIELLLNSVNEKKIDSFREIFPDLSMRNRAFVEIRNLIPKTGNTWRLGFSRPNSNEVILSTDRAIAFIDEELTQDVPEDTITTVTGELIRIDFDKRTVVLRYPPTRKELECMYFEELEEKMIKNRRELIQATGQFTLDSEGHPTKLTNVSRIEAVDLSAIIIKEFDWNERRFILDKSLNLVPYLDEETQQLMIVEEPELDIYVFAQTREQLVQEISEQLAFMWDTYAMALEESLTADAVKLSSNLKQKLREVK
jgi:hypothetical protein